MLESCRVLIVDADLDYAARLAGALGRLHRSGRLDADKLHLELSNSAYYVARCLREGNPQEGPWDVIFAEVCMPVPSNGPGQPIEETVSGTRYDGWTCWRYDYTWNLSPEHHDLEHGGLHIARAIEELRSAGKTLGPLKLVLVSRALPQDARLSLYERATSNRDWLWYREKIDWEGEAGSLTRNVWAFEWALIQAIKDRHSPLWGAVPLGGVVCLSPAMQNVESYVKRLASDRQVKTVLIRGEIGTGKTLIAKQWLHKMRMRAIHGTIPDDRIEALFCPKPCTAIPENLFELEFFGTEPNVYTGAPHTTRVGLVDRARGGTLFLDEIGDMPAGQQAKLLKLVEERTFHRVGGLDLQHSEAELIVCATHQPLEEMVRQKTFREDLFSRLTESVVVIPPLRERRQEIVPIARAHLDIGVAIEKKAEAFLAEQDWPGNVRQLRNLVRNAARVDPRGVVSVEALRLVIAEAGLLHSHVLSHPSNEDITPETIVEGRHKWEQVQSLEYPRRVATMVVAQSLWRRKGKGAELARRIGASPDALDRFFSTARSKVRTGQLQLQDLERFVDASHCGALRDWLLSIEHSSKKSLPESR